MALIQSACLPGPSWDEEVVPALRKRLENESRTLTSRMSAISMTSIADDSPLSAFNSNSAVDAPSVSGLRQNKRDEQGIPSSNGTGYLVHHQTISQADPAASSGAPGTGASVRFRKPSATTSFHRSRTFSQPYATPNINGGIRQPSKTNLDGHNNLRSRSPRLVDAKPTRIPKASRGPFGITADASSPEVLFLTNASPDVSHPKHSYATDIRAYHFPTSHSVQGIPQHTTARLVNEPAPFNTTSSSSSIYNVIETDELGYNASGPSRNSIDSTEERPFEHWYRGENSRNGGVGELRVGRRQEMLDIANYGHSMHNKHKLLANRQAALALEDARRTSYRKRAESMAGFKFSRSGLQQRGSLYLEDDTVMDRIERVLDEDPLTDLDGEEGSDIVSYSTKGQHDRRSFRYSNHDTDSYPGVGDVKMATAIVTDSSLSQSPVFYEVEEPAFETPKQQYTASIQPVQSVSIAMLQPQAQTFDASIITAPQYSPTAPAVSPTPRSGSRQSGSSSRIPTYERRSSESRTSAPSQHSSNTTKVVYPVPAVDLSVSPTPLPSVIATTSSTARNSAAPISVPKRGASPGPYGTLGSAVKRPQMLVSIAQPKTKPTSKPAIKKLVKEDNRQSVAQYPTLSGEADGLDMSDAIPYWTQPKIVGGNWDDVVLPVVARKKGLDDHYERADGSPQPKRKQEASIPPAPGTFGYDGSKVRHKGKDIEMDEFGQPQSATNSTQHILEDVEPSQFLEELPVSEGASKTEVSGIHDNICVPAESPPSPPPFAHYAPTTTKHLTQPTAVGVVGNEQQAVLEQDEKGAGCCKCIVM